MREGNVLKSAYNDIRITWQNSEKDASKWISYTKNGPEWRRAIWYCFEPKGGSYISILCWDSCTAGALYHGYITCIILETQNNMYF